MNPHARRRLLLWLALCLGAAALLFAGYSLRRPRDPELRAVAALTREFLPTLEARLAPHGGAGGRSLVLDLSGPGRAAFRPALDARLTALAVAAPLAASEQMPLHLSLAWSIEDGALHLRGSIRTLRLETFVEERYPLDR